MRNDALYRMALRSLLSESTSTPSVQPAKQRTAADTPFGETLNQLLGEHSAGQKVSEEDLFAAAVGQQIKDQIGDEAYETYRTAFQIAMTGAAPGRSLPSSQYSARQAVHYLVLTEAMTRDQSKSLRGVARQSAQLDDDPRLFDGYAGPGEETKAVSKFSEAQAMVVERLAAAAVTQANLTASLTSSTNVAAASITSQPDSSSDAAEGARPRFAARLLA